MRPSANQDGHVKVEPRWTGPNRLARLTIEGMKIMATKSIRHVEPNCQATTDTPHGANAAPARSDPPMRPELIKPGYRFGRRVVTHAHGERKHRIVHGVEYCSCRGAFGFISNVDPGCELIEWTEYRYTVRCDCGCVRIMDWWAVTHGGRLTCNRNACECKPKLFPELYSALESMPDARAA
jgi:hypothetical protein